MCRAFKPDGEFDTRLEFGVPGGVTDLALADLDHDGRLDAIACGQGGVFVLANRGGAIVDSSRVAARIGGGPADAILARDRGGAVTLVLAGDSRHDTARIVPATVRLAGAPPLRGRERLRDDVGRAAIPPDLCTQLVDNADGRVDLELEFAAADVLAGWSASNPGKSREEGGANMIALPWSASNVDGVVLEGVACALVVGEGAMDFTGAPRMVAFGPASDRDAGVGVTLDLPRATTVAEVSLFDVVGRRVALLHHGPLEAGFHRLPWVGAAPRPGIYFARAQLDDGVLRARVLVLR